MKNKLQFYRCMIDPGYLAFSDEPTLLFSVCGRGVIVTLWDKRRCSGGMAHCIFPKRPQNVKPANYYVEDAVSLLVKQFLNSDSDRNNLQAQIFGGGSINGVSRKMALKTVKAARRTIRNFHIEIVSEDVGGSLGRKIVFNTSVGDTVVVKTKAIRLTDWAPEYALNLESKTA